MKFHMRPLLSVFAIALLFTACNSIQQKLFSSHPVEKKKSKGPIEATVEKVKTKAKRDIAPDDKALTQPLAINLPYRETSYFEKDGDVSNGYSFKAKRGERVKIFVGSEEKGLYTQVWEKQLESNPELLGTINGTGDTLLFDVDKDGDYIIRLEPEKLKYIPFTVTITSGPSLIFPINASDKPRISSFWGASRDDGSRSHEGIDIVAKKYTPVIAVADGQIIAVKNGGLGGKTISLRPDGKDFSVYFAHLDQQLVETGQYVHAGDTIGLVGNTGNAAKTVPHLHFGIYTQIGAIDPLAFINNAIQNLKPVKADTTNILGNAKTRTATTLFANPGSVVKKKLVPSNQPVKLLAATDNYYRVRFADGEEGFVPANFIAREPVKIEAAIKKESSGKKEPVGISTRTARVREG